MAFVRYEEGWIDQRNSGDDYKGNPEIKPGRAHRRLTSAVQHCHSCHTHARP